MVLRQPTREDEGAGVDMKKLLFCMRRLPFLTSLFQCQSYHGVMKALPCRHFKLGCRWNPPALTVLLAKQSIFEAVAAPLEVKRWKSTLSRQRVVNRAIKTEASGHLFHGYVPSKEFYFILTIRFFLHV
ncbi:hypothetical protein MUK42_32544 [Musa troglodytarum]|uniref:Uncharacterized protein n=1 Tax=Musa troglodytarum TaxID=320322 RepID=A0A9E7HHX9_9LILI|nr:hypothetical protein MUK42_32544 [Musa troglodytarum]URE30280.1 hypothetical protein MUK42_32544 [Musa troglodytarum]URE30282.1 hypothetical protein MUK42_32544 [Musa troglodytarum]URE30285.1 hypothetical protein MUK42_32544 [Musa troglodytarum]